MGTEKIRNTLLAGAVVIVAAAGLSLVALSRGSEWTTTSNEALDEFQAGLEASQKLYPQEARAHFEMALKLDPDFVMAKLRVADYCRHDDGERAEQLVEEVFSDTLDRLTPREKFLVERARLLIEDKYEEATVLLDEYVDAYPNDPHILYIQALRAWQNGKLEEAEKLNKRLLEIDPNWVIAYNQLGYITMMQGRFAESEEYFTSYRFIAPDQANPHDSLGELFIVLGRYEEAERSLDRALASKPDFMAAFEHLAMLDGLRNEWDRASEHLERGFSVGALGEKYLVEFECTMAFWHLSTEGNWKDLMELADEECKPGKGSQIYSSIHIHQAACKLGDWETAEAIEAGLRESLDKSSQGMDIKTGEILWPTLSHMEGIRLLHQGDVADAAEALKKADQGLTYINAGLGIFKLSNRMVLAHTLKQLDRDAEAHALIAKVKAVNSRLADQLQEEFFGDSVPKNPVG